MRRWHVPIIFIFLVLPALVGVALAQSDFPARSDPYVNDYAEVLAAEDEATLRRRLVDFQQQTGVEMTVLTIDSIHAYGSGTDTLESFAAALFNRWQIDDQATNDGVLILVAVDDRQVRIELGAGYSSAYNDAMQRVIDEEMLPHFRQANYADGIFAGVAGVETAVSDGPAGEGFLAGLARRARQSRLLRGLFLLVIVVVLYRRRPMRGGCLLKPITLALYAVVGAALGAVVGTAAGLITVEPTMVETAVGQLQQVAASGELWRRMMQFEEMTVNGAGIGALVGAIVWFLPGMRDDDGDDGGGSSGGGGASGGW